MKKIIYFFAIVFIFTMMNNIAKAQTQFVSYHAVGKAFCIADKNFVAPLMMSDDDWQGVSLALHSLQTDLKNVTGKEPVIVTDLQKISGKAIIVGTIGHSKIIDQLIRTRKINVAGVAGQWESTLIQMVADSPIAGIDSALVIAGSDKRGTIYGIYEMSRQMGVSPWYWWADVPVQKHETLYALPQKIVLKSPSVKYRGIFLNDEAPSLSGWVQEKYGNYNHLFYEKVFELLLRLKANYLWPAMWNNAFNDDDTLNSVLADEYGIVMGTSHHEPMLRAQQEWKRYGSGAWNYEQNKQVLQNFWRKGIENMGTHESIVTIGMRGDGDLPMTEGSNISLLENIVKDQRQIIADVTKKDPSQTPQLWALYKEVQDYYDKGMRVPDDVTLLLCDDNWGNIRKLPKLTDSKRSGGYGIYYHFDYVGDPRNYKWINTNNIARVWEQMHLAYEYGVNQIWIVNVGDLKPMELPISFFLDYAYDTKKWNEDNVQNYYEHWASEQFGKTHAKEIGNILKKYSQYSSRIKPELLHDKTYSIFNFNEWNFVLNQWKNLLAQAEKINSELHAEYKNAYFELALHPIKAMENLHELYYDVAMNKLLASQGDIAANDFADKAKQAYINDSLISLEYNRLNNGKWNHIMDQTHIGYTYWQQPDKQKMPEVEYVSQNAERHKLPIIDTTAKTVKLPIKAFQQEKNYVSIQAAHYTKAINAKNIQWKIIKNIGRDGDGVTTFPVTKTLQTLAASNPQLQYEIYTLDTGNVSLNVYFSPTLNFHNDSLGLQYAISIDDEQPQIVSINKNNNDDNAWRHWVSNNIIIKTTQHSISSKGKHVVKYWMISNAVVLQKIILNFGKEKYSLLGAPESYFEK